MDAVFRQYDFVYKTQAALEHEAWNFEAVVEARRGYKTVMHFRILLFALLLAASSLAQDFRSAIALRIVTPDPLLPVSGGIGASHPTTRTLGDLTVRALVLERGETRVAI